MVIPDAAVWIPQFGSDFPDWPLAHPGEGPRVHDGTYGIELVVPEAADEAERQILPELIGSYVLWDVLEKEERERATTLFRLSKFHVERRGVVRFVLRNDPRLMDEESLLLLENHGFRMTPQLSPALQTQWETNPHNSERQIRYFTYWELMSLELEEWDDYLGVLEEVHTRSFQKIELLLKQDPLLQDPDTVKALQKLGLTKILHPGAA